MEKVGKSDGRTDFLPFYFFLFFFFLLANFGIFRGDRLKSYLDYHRMKVLFTYSLYIRETIQIDRIDFSIATGGEKFSRNASIDPLDPFPEI